MEIVHVVPGISEEASGPAYSIPRLCQSLAARGNHVILSCAGSKGQIRGIDLVDHPRWQLFSRFAISPRHIAYVASKAQSADIIHNHSLWTLINMAAGWVVPGRKAKLVTSPRGTLSSWALGRRSILKWLLWPIQKRVLARADLLHATSEAEYLYIRQEGFTRPVAIIPNGIDLPEPRAGRELTDVRTLLFLSRIHPTKCVDRLLYAWQQLQHSHPNWQLVVAGRGEPGYVKEIEELAVRLGLIGILFVGPLYGVAKTKAYLEAELFVLPTHSENFGMVVAEALSHGCPAIVSKGAPWSKLKNEGCGWWIQNEIPDLVSTLNEAMSLPAEELTRMGTKGRAWMERDYSWDTVAYQMEAAYQWIISGGICPDCVREN